MKRKKPFWQWLTNLSMRTWQKVGLLGLLMLCVLAVSSLPSQAVALSAVSGYFVRIPAANVPQAAALELNPHVAVDYGSFQWLELGQADYDRLVASGVSFTLVTDAGTVQIVSYKFDPVVSGEPALAPSMRTTTNGATFRLIQFVGPVNDTWLDAMTAAGLPT